MHHAFVLQGFAIRLSLFHEADRPFVRKQGHLTHTQMTSTFIEVIDREKNVQVLHCLDKSGGNINQNA